MQGLLESDSLPSALHHFGDLARSMTCLEDKRAKEPLPKYAQLCSTTALLNYVHQLCTSPLLLVVPSSTWIACVFFGGFFWNCRPEGRGRYRHEGMAIEMSVTCGARRFAWAG
jgi:hypothetical protein